MDAADSGSEPRTGGELLLDTLLAAAVYERAASCGGPALLELKIGIEDMLAANPRA